MNGSSSISAEAAPNLPYSTVILGAGEAGTIDAVCTQLASGHPVALPTETVYGLAADALQPAAVAAVFAAKERPSFDPLIVHLPDWDWVDRLVDGVLPPLAEKLMRAFWPGPLTILLPKSALVPDIVTAGLPRVALRMSRHAVMQKVMEQWGRPLAAPSANRFGRISPVTALDVMEELQGRIPLIVDGGRCERGIESTIISVLDEEIHILRAGPVTQEQLLEYGKITMANTPSNSPVPGQLPSHYAPGKSLRLIEEGDGVGEREALIVFRSWRNQHAGRQIRLSENGDLAEAAANLFAALRKADASEADGIVVERVPARGIGVAIMERLERAAGRHRS